MKPRDKAQHDAKMRAMREAGKTASNAPVPRDVPGGLARHSPPPAQDRDEVPWRDAAYFDAHWQDDAPSLRDLLANERNLYHPDYDELNPEAVEALDLDDVLQSATMDNYLDGLRDRLKSRLMFGAAAGQLSNRDFLRELDHFDSHTADEVADRLALHLQLELRREAGLA